MIVLNEKICIVEIILSMFLCNITFSSFSQCNQNYNWVTWTDFTGNSAIGSVSFNGQSISLDMTSNFNFTSTPSIYNYYGFSSFNGTIPNSTVPCTTWAYGLGGTTSMCFSQQVENPVLLISSLGAPWLTVSLSFSEPYLVLFDGGGMSYINDTTIIGTEGSAIILFPGDFKCVTINSNTPEYYTNITWGLNPPLFPVSISGNIEGCDSVVLTASGGVAYSWNGGAYPNNATNVFHKSGNYTVTVTDSNGCTTTALRTVTINPLVTIKTTINKTICSNQLPYFWNKQNLTVAGTYTSQHTSISGCDGEF